MLTNKIVVITGGAGLIGRAFVREIVENNGTVIVADLNLRACADLLKELSDWIQNDQILVYETDTTNKNSIAHVIRQTHERFGRIDALINNAYPRNNGYGKRFEEVVYDDFCQNISMHIGGCFLASQQFAEYFKKQGRGNIINMASIYGTATPRFQIYDRTSMTMPVEYAAIKAAVIQLTKYMAQYFKRSGIRVNCISPGGILDGQPREFLASYNSYGASKGMLDPGDITGALLFLLSEMSEYVNGQNIVVDDGWSL